MALAGTPSTVHNWIHVCTLIKQSKSSQNQHFYMLCVTWGGGVANNLHDASHQPHLTESFLILCCTSCELTEGSPTPQLYIYIVDPAGQKKHRKQHKKECRKLLAEKKLTKQAQGNNSNEEVAITKQEKETEEEGERKENDNVIMCQPNQTKQ